MREGLRKLNLQPKVDFTCDDFDRFTGNGWALTRAT